MWRYLVAVLVLLLSMGGLVSAQGECTDCYANIVVQDDVQIVQNVRLADEVFDNDVLDTQVAVGNEGLTAGIIVAAAPVEPTDANTMFATAPFARIDQGMIQTVSNLGTPGDTGRDGAKGITWNKAIQAAWVANQGAKEIEFENMVPMSISKEGAYVSQLTVQRINNIYDYDSKEASKVLNVDNKLAMIVDNLANVIDLTAKASSEASDSQSSAGSVVNSVDITVSGTDP